MPQAPMNYLSWAPLYQYLDARFDPAFIQHRHLVGTDIADILGVNPAQMMRWNQSGQIPFWDADVYASRLGIHPSLIWGEEYWTLMDVMTERAEASYHNRLRGQAAYRQRRKATTHEDHDSAVA